MSIDAVVTAEGINQINLINPMTPDTFKQTRQALGWSISDCSRHILQSERNIRRMEDGTRPIMPQTEKLMQIYYDKLKAKISG